MANKSDLIIVGGGLNGQVLSLALASVGLSSTVLDRAAPDITAAAFDGRAYAIALTSVNIFRALGLWDQIAPNAEPIRDIKVSEGRVGRGAAPFTLHFDHAELEEGPMGQMIEDRHLRSILMEAIASSDLITWHSSTDVVGQSVNGTTVDVTTAQGDAFSASVLIGCDGRGSRVAARAGIGRVAWDYRQTGLVCAIAHERPHLSTAHQFFAPSGPLAVLPLRGNRSSIVWSEERSKAEEIQARDEAGYLAALRPLIGGYLGDIKLDGERFSYPLGLSLARRFIANRVALVGDAAHGIHPLAGQGLNLGFRDTAALVELLASARRRGQDIGTLDVLRSYEQWRRPDATALALATDGLNRLYGKVTPGISTMRNVGIGAINAVPALRRGFMRQAAGLNGTLPQMMLGRAV
ncbi:MAG: UbiH/UbiF/VisC/COQ6 family ubiquinone biosynthesis hydroxylase [Pseudomonadota bacterium]